MEMAQDVLTRTAPRSVLFSQPLSLRTVHDLPDHFTCLPGEAGLSYAFGQKYPPRIADYILRGQLALHLLRQRHHYSAIVTGRYGEGFAILQGLIPFGRKPHLLLDVEWPTPRTSGWRRLASRWYHRLVARGAWKIQVFCEAEADTYAEHVGIPRDRFVWVPYCTDQDGADYGVAEGDYLFTGGLHHRDYTTLGRALAEQPLPLWVAAPPEHLHGLGPTALPLGRVSRDEYFRAMARSRLVVQSLQAGVLRFPGVITYVTAMRMGKCVVVNETRGARSYIRDGETGILVPPGDPQALADALRRLWHDDRLRRQIGERARAYAARHFSTARWLADVEALARQERDGSPES
jgi:glycosyltransferase involved in cell wall biosynthesis